MGRNKKIGVARPGKKTDAAFSKTKKKVGKKILKSNDTVISIKTRKIVLPEQHATKDSNMVFKGKSISEYITGTKHTNSNQRIQNLVNTQEMLSTNLHLIEPNAGALIERLGAVLQDPEENVRSSALVLVKTILNHIKSEDLLPFLQVFIAQLSSGLLHIDKGVQKTTVLVLLCLFQNHISNTMTFSEPLLSSLVTLLSANRNKQNTLLYFQAIALILKFYVHSEDSRSYETQKSSSVNLYKYTSRQEAVTSRPSQSNLLVRVCECALPHVETIWLEDTPSQVYAQAEPNVLKTVSSLVDFLILVHKSDLKHSKLALVKLNNISKSVAGRFPLTCSVPNRDTNVLWSLNLKMAQFLLAVEKFSKVERYFVYYFKSRIQELSESDVSDGLALLARIPSPAPDTISELLAHAVSTATHAPLFLSQFVRTPWLHSVNLKSNSQFLTSLQEHINHVAPDIVNSFYKSQPSGNTLRSGVLTPGVPTQILALCLDKTVYGLLPESEQVRCLELYFGGGVVLSPRSVSDLGHVSRTSSVKAKFYSVLLALLHEEKMTIEDYISILLSQANKDDEEGEEETGVDMRTVRSFTSQLLTNFTPLPHAVRLNLFQISLPQIVERLYAGLSDFSLTSYLIILTQFTSYSEDSELELQVPETLVVRLGKIICSLIFNRDSVSDWGGDIVKLAVKLSVNQHVIFRYITQQMNLENKPTAILSWYLKVALKLLQSGQVYKLGLVHKSGVDKFMGHLKGRVSKREYQELVYRMEDTFSVMC
ncbi:uncharacterized protein LOC134817594 [Bolinopsis microptera]|uniref:uncharacterized protein LOC134817594 n=1 Tax=Bolinopsis microptera TaxID=2820187 RepID=UPI00307A900F